MSQIAEDLNIQEIVNTNIVEYREKGTLWDKMEFNRFGIVAMVILFHSCLGSIAVMTAHQMDGSEAVISLSLVVFSNMAANAMCLAVQPMKVIIGLSALSIIISSIIILMELF